MSDTPETDAEAWIETDRANAVVFAKFARKLERERAEAREELSLKCQSVTIASGTISDLLKKSERLEKQIEGLNNFANERFDEIQRVRRERDEAREAFVIATDQMVIAQGEVREANKERDEARFLLRAAQSALDAIHLEVGGWIKIMKENTD
jgi:predicted house-cleaning NTP pyrophosphatase (Maf/HAM1 superfamily)